jgi:hypothetical protein
MKDFDEDRFTTSIDPQLTIDVLIQAVKELTREVIDLEDRVGDIECARRTDIRTTRRNP